MTTPEEETAPQQNLEAPPRVAWLERDSLLRRTADEAYRSARYGTPFAVLLVHLQFTNHGADHDIKDFVNADLRELDFAGRVADGQYVFGMPNSTMQGAVAVANRLRAVLVEYRPRTGVAEAPSYGITPQALLTYASMTMTSGT